MSHIIHTEPGVEKTREDPSLSLLEAPCKYCGILTIAETVVQWLAGGSGTGAGHVLLHSSQQPTSHRNRLCFYSGLMKIK